MEEPYHPPPPPEQTEPKTVLRFAGGLEAPGNGRVQSTLQVPAVMSDGIFLAWG